MTETTAIVSLAEVKAHARVDHDDEDAGIAAMLAAAQRHMEAWVGPFADFGGDVPDDLKEALKMHVAHMYDCRHAAEADAPSLVPLGYHDLIGPHRKWEF